MYFAGEEVEKSFTEARKLFKKSADQNYDVAQFRLGQMIIRGQGSEGERNFAEGITLIMKSAAQGNEEAKTYLTKVSEVV